MNITSQFRFWAIACVSSLFLIWLLSDVLFPFFVGFILAYVLNPAVDKLENHNIGRLLATNLVMLGFLVGIVLFCLLFVPILTDQMNSLIDNTPHYIKRADLFLSEQFGSLWQDIFSKNNPKTENYLTDAIKNAAGITKNLLDGLIVGSLSIIRWFTFLIIIFVIAFYMLLDWRVMINKVDSWLPRLHAPTIRRLIGEIDTVQSAFIRGQILVCMVQSIFYIVTLSIIGLEYAFILGLTTGVLTFIPYVGASIGFILSIGIGLAQFLPDYGSLLLVGVIFALGQTLEAYVWLPKLVGDSVDLHPVWIMFALTAFGSLFGIAGMLIAVPVTAAIGVLTRYGLERYILSPYYSDNTKY